MHEEDYQLSIITHSPHLPWGETCSLQIHSISPSPLPTCLCSQLSKMAGVPCGLTPASSLPPFKSCRMDAGAQHRPCRWGQCLNMSEWWMNESLFLTFLFQVCKREKETPNQDKPQDSLCMGRIVKEKEALFVKWIKKVITKIQGRANCCNYSIPTPDLMRMKLLANHSVSYWWCFRAAVTNRWSVDHR